MDSYRAKLKKTHPSFQAVCAQNEGAKIVLCWVRTTLKRKWASERKMKKSRIRTRSTRDCIKLKSGWIKANASRNGFCRKISIFSPEVFSIWKWLILRALKAYIVTAEFIISYGTNHILALLISKLISVIRCSELRFRTVLSN